MPDIFVSSTHYDLRDLRGTLAEFLKVYGNPLLSSEKGFPHSTALPPSVSCLQTLERCELVIVVLDRRYGDSIKEWHPFPYENLSPVHAEVRHALKLQKRLLVFVRDDVMAAYQLGWDATIEPSANRPDPRVLEVIREMNAAPLTPWIRKFDDVNDIKEDLTGWFKSVLDENWSRPGLSISHAPVLSSTAEIDVPADVATSVHEFEVLISEILGGCRRQNSVNLSADELVRLHLFTSAAAGPTVADELLSTHTMNAVYTRRSGITPSPAERRLILRTALGDVSDVHPAWYWFRENEAKLIESLNIIARSDSNDTVRIAAIRILTTLHPTEELGWVLLEELPSVERDDLKLAILYYASGVEGEVIATYLTTLDLSHQGGVVNSGLKVARARSAFNMRDQRAVLLLTELDESEVSSCEEYLRSAVSIAESAILRLAIERVKNVRSLEEIVRELERRAEDVVDILENAVRVGSTDVCEVAAKLMLDRGISLDLDQIERIEVGDAWNRFRLTKLEFDIWPLDAVEAEIDWLSPERGAPAYESFATRALSAAQVRHDLQSDFHDLRAKSIDRYLVKNDVAGISARADPNPEVQMILAATVEDSVREIVRNHSTTMLNRFRAAALRTLVGRALRADRDMVFGYLRHTDSDIVSAAIDLLAETGGVQDVDELLKIAEADILHADGLIDAALRLDSSSALPHLLCAESSRLVGFAIAFLVKNRMEDFEEAVVKLLFSPSALKRELACAYVFNLWTPNRLEHLLHSYSQSGWYYYDVVCWLDRFLYAPPRLAERYRRELIKRTAPKAIQSTRLFRARAAAIANANAK